MYKKFFIFIGLMSINCIIADSCQNTCAPTNSCVNTCEDNCPTNVFGKTFFSYRPQDSNVAQRMVGVIDTINQYETECTYGTLSASIAYSQTRNPNKLAQFFSFTGNNSMTYGPECLSFITTGTIHPRGQINENFDIYGINFGTTSTGQICLRPQIKNVIFDVDIYTDWSECFWGLKLWTRANLPLVNTKWNLHLKDACDIQEGTSNFATFLVSSKDVNVTVPTPNDLSHAFAGPAFGQVPALNFGKVNGEREKTALAGFHFEIGYDFWKSQTGFFVAGLHMVAPTGNTPNAHYLFEPIAGANHAWQLGATLQAGYSLWQSNCDNKKNISIYFDSIITHLFPSEQRRLFGLLINDKTSPGSSYLVLKHYDKNGTLLGLERAANLLACETKIKVDVMADLAIMLQYNSDCYMAGLGWNFWYRSKEKPECETICKVRCCPFSHNDKYAIKGDALADNINSESKATIGTCSSEETSPVYLTDKDIDRSIALNPSTYSNKIFGFVGRNWTESDIWTPYVLLEGEVEFGHKNTAADQWSIMLKGGVSF